MEIPRHQVRFRKTKRRPVHEPSPGEILVKNLPPGVWRIPPSRWVFSLTRHDGLKDVRKFNGTLAEAHAQRDVYMKTGNYSMSWLMEDDRPSLSQGNRR